MVTKIEHKKCNVQIERNAAFCNFRLLSSRRNGKARHVGFSLCFISFISLISLSSDRYGVFLFSFTRISPRPRVDERSYVHCSKLARHFTALSASENHARSVFTFCSFDNFRKKTSFLNQVVFSYLVFCFSMAIHSSWTSSPRPSLSNSRNRWFVKSCKKKSRAEHESALGPKFGCSRQRNQTCDDDGR